jgi:hypothetical protein
MNIIELIEREHERIARDFGHYAAMSHSSAAWRLGRSVVARTAAYLWAQERTLYTSVLAVEGRSGPVAMGHFLKIRRRVADALARYGQAEPHFPGDTHVAAVMLKLQQEFERFTRREVDELCPALADMFSQSELRVLGGEMLLRLASNRGVAARADRRRSVFARMLVWLRRQARCSPPGPGRAHRAPPTLCDALPITTVVRHMQPVRAVYAGGPHDAQAPQRTPWAAARRSAEPRHGFAAASFTRPDVRNFE